MSTVSRRTKWHPSPPPPPSPKILHFPRRRRTRRRKLTKPHDNPLLLMNKKYLSLKGNLESLFEQENLPLERRERVEEREEEEGDCGGLAEEKWRFQAEMLRAECNLLRMEREFALKKLEKNRLKMETTLRSAVHTLLSGRKKMVEGKSGNAVLEEEIEDLAEKLEELQKNSIIKGPEVVSCSNFDKKACLLQRPLEKLGGLPHQNCVDDLQRAADSCFPTNTSRCRDILKESSVSYCKNDNESTHEAMPQENKCSGRCKAVVLRIVQQVRAETEQWSQMQKMLEQVRGDMEELQTSRDYWETRAHTSDYEIESLRHAVEEWKQKALDYEKEVHELENKLSLARQKMHKSKLDLRPGENNVVPLGAQLVNERLALKKDPFLEEMKIEENTNNELPPLSLAKQLAKEKRSLLRGLKENRHSAQEKDSNSKQGLGEDGRSRRYSSSYGAVASNRSPLREIANSSSLARQKHRAAFDYHSLERSRIRELQKVIGWNKDESQKI